MTQSVTCRPGAAPASAMPATPNWPGCCSSAVSWSGLTRLPGLRLMLKMMRRPAQAAGLDALQQFLEAGFDTFAALARHPQGVAQFLERIESREAALMRDLSLTPRCHLRTQLRQLLGQAR